MQTILLARTLGLCLIVAALIACNGGKDDPFGRECEAIRRSAPAEARLVNSVAPHASGYGTEARWDYEFPGNEEATRAAFRKSVPAEYKPVNNRSGDVVFTRYDGHDSFSITYGFVLSNSTTTKVSVTVRAVPD